MLLPLSTIGAIVSLLQDANHFVPFPIGPFDDIFARTPGVAGAPDRYDPFKQDAANSIFVDAGRPSRCKYYSACSIRRVMLSMDTFQFIRSNEAR